MNLLFVSAMGSSPWGGSEELWSQAALRLRAQGHQVSASVVWWPQLSHKISNLSQNGIDVVTQERPPASMFDMIQRRMKKKFGAARPEVTLLREKKPDLVIVSQGYNRDGLEWMQICRENNFPYAPVIQCNAETWWPSDDVAGEMAVAYASAKKVFCVSRHNLELLESQIGESLPNGAVVWNPFNVPSGEPPVWPPEDGNWKLACVARLETAAKGQDLLFRVLAKPIWRERKLELNLYGAGGNEQNLKKLAHRHGLTNVHFRGHVADVRAIWATNHLLILPSRYEGLPLALVEAMWCARPAVVTDSGGNAEVCVDDDTGFVAEAPAVSLLESAMERAWEMRYNWEKMGQRARTRVERIVPKDPINDFCQQVVACVKN